MRAVRRYLGVADSYVGPLDNGDRPLFMVPSPSRSSDLRKSLPDSFNASAKLSFKAQPVAGEMPDMMPSASVSFPLRA